MLQKGKKTRMEHPYQKGEDCQKPASEQNGLVNTDFILEEKGEYSTNRCALCGNPGPAVSFKNKKICMHCINYVKSN